MFGHERIILATKSNFQPMAGDLFTVSQNRSTGDRSYVGVILSAVAIHEGYMVAKTITKKSYATDSDEPVLLNLAEFYFYPADALKTDLDRAKPQPELAEMAE